MALLHGRNRRQFLFELKIQLYWTLDICYIFFLPSNNIPRTWMYPGMASTKHYRKYLIQYNIAKLFLQLVLTRPHKLYSTFGDLIRKLILTLFVSKFLQSHLYFKKTPNNCMSINILGKWKISVLCLLSQATQLFSE